MLIAELKRWLIFILEISTLNVRLHITQRLEAINIGRGYIGEYISEF